MKKSLTVVVVLLASFVFLVPATANAYTWQTVETWSLGVNDDVSWSTIETWNNLNVESIAPPSDAYYEVNIDSTNTPIDEDQDLTITATITNTGEQEGTQTVFATHSESATEYDSRDVTLSGGSSTQETFTIPSEDVTSNIETVYVYSDNGYDATSVTVNETTSTASKIWTISNFENWKQGNFNGVFLENEWLTLEILKTFEDQNLNSFINSHNFTTTNTDSYNGSYSLTKSSKSDDVMLLDNSYFNQNQVKLTYFYKATDPTSRSRLGMVVANQNNEGYGITPDMNSTKEYFFSFSDLDSITTENTLNVNFSTDTWYKMELVYNDNGTITGNVYDTSNNKIDGKSITLSKYSGIEKIGIFGYDPTDYGFLDDFQLESSGGTWTSQLWQHRQGEDTMIEEWTIGTFYEDGTSVDARIGVDSDNDQAIEEWSNWQTLENGINTLSGLVESRGYGYKVEYNLQRSDETKTPEVLDYELEVSTYEWQTVDTWTLSFGENVYNWQQIENWQNVFGENEDIENLSWSLIQKWDETVNGDNVEGIAIEQLPTTLSKALNITVETAEIMSSTIFLMIVVLSVMIIAGVTGASIGSLSVLLLFTISPTLGLLTALRWIPLWIPIFLMFLVFGYLGKKLADEGGG